MVEGADALLSLAQLAVALAGFTSVVIVFRRPEADLHPYDAHRIKISLTTTLAPAFLALLPVGLSLTGLSDGVLWRLCSALGAIVSIGCVVFETRGRRGLPPPARALLNPTVLRIFHILFGAALTLHLINVFGLFPKPQAGLYFLALVFSLCFGALVFARFPFIRPHRPSD